jgi:hypothetical protein
MELEDDLRDVFCFDPVEEDQRPVLEANLSSVAFSSAVTAAVLDENSVSSVDMERTDHLSVSLGQQLKNIEALLQRPPLFPNLPSFPSHPFHTFNDLSEDIYAKHSLSGTLSLKNLLI